MPLATSSAAEDDRLTRLFERNRKGAEQKTHTDPGFFRHLVDQQKPGRTNQLMGKFTSLALAK